MFKAIGLIENMEEKELAQQNSKVIFHIYLFSGSLCSVTEHSLGSEANPSPLPNETEEG